MRKNFSPIRLKDPFVYSLPDRWIDELVVTGRRGSEAIVIVGGAATELVERQSQENTIY